MTSVILVTFPIRKTWLALAAAALLSACATPVPVDYTAFKKSNPRSILVLPPLNQSPDIRATYGVLASVTRPLAESGYYVFPVALVDQTFKENGLGNAGEMHQAPLNKIREIFGTDAVLYITVEQYGASFKVIDSATVVTARGQLVDAKTGTTLWEGKATASDAENRQNNSGGLLGLLVTAMVRQALGSLGDSGYPVARITNARLLHARPGGLLFGPRSPQYGKDGGASAR